MSLRTWNERALQAIAYEVGGLCLIVPVYSLLSGSAAEGSTILLAVLSAIVLIWAPLHNAIFDRLEWRLAGRVASDRPARWRVVHALSLEATVLMLTCPAIMLIADKTLGQALMVNLWLTLLYTAYAYVFHLAADRLRPVVAHRASEGLDVALRPQVVEFGHKPGQPLHYVISG